MDAQYGRLDFGFPRRDIIHCKLLNVLHEGPAGLDNDGFEDAVRPAESDQIRSSPVSSVDDGQAVGLVGTVAMMLAAAL